jgi:riboflavin synthase
VFTGIIEELGAVASFETNGNGARMRFTSSLVTSDSKDGDSIAVNGVCLTALDVSAGGFSADLSRETLDRSTLGSLQTGSKVNLERALLPTTRLGGHLVQGHVDGRGTFVSTDKHGDFYTVRIGFPSELAKYFIYKGSVAVEGISLTIASLADSQFDIAIIPKTWESTNLSTLHAGDPVNLEVDLIAKYIERMLNIGESAAADLRRKI